MPQAHNADHSLGLASELDRFRAQSISSGSGSCDSLARQPATDRLSNSRQGLVRVQSQQHQVAAEATFGRCQPIGSALIHSIRDSAWKRPARARANTSGFPPASNRRLVLGRQKPANSGAKSGPKSAGHIDSSALAYRAKSSLFLALAEVQTTGCRVSRRLPIFDTLRCDLRESYRRPSRLWLSKRKQETLMKWSRRWRVSILVSIACFKEANSSDEPD